MSGKLSPAQEVKTIGAEFEQHLIGAIEALEAGTPVTEINNSEVAKLVRMVELHDALKKGIQDRRAAETRQWADYEAECAINTKA